LVRFHEGGGQAYRNVFGEKVVGELGLVYFGGDVYHGVREELRFLAALETGVFLVLEFQIVLHLIVQGCIIRLEIIDVL
jgi:hypothetical protein